VLITGRDILDDRVISQGQFHDVRIFCQRIIIQVRIDDPEHGVQGLLDILKGQKQGLNGRIHGCRLIVTVLILVEIFILGAFQELAEISLPAGWTVNLPA